MLNFELACIADMSALKFKRESLWPISHTKPIIHKSVIRLKLAYGAELWTMTISVEASLGMY